VRSHDASGPATGWAAHFPIGRRCHPAAPATPAPGRVAQIHAATGRARWDLPFAPPAPPGAVMPGVATMRPPEVAPWEHHP
jgi:hypothetical protein